MEKNLEEMIKSLEEEKHKIENEMNSETDAKIVMEMKGDLKKIEKEIEKWKIQEGLMALEGKKREIEDALKSESDPRIKDEMKIDLLRIEEEIKEKSDRYGFKNREDKEQDKLNREEAINKSRELQKTLEVLENRKQEILNALRKETDSKIVSEMKEDLKKVEQEIKSKTNELNSVKNTYKISEAEIAESKPEPTENGIDDLTPGEIEALNEITSGLGRQSDSNNEPEPMKEKNEYDWGDLTEDQIDDLWAEGIVPGSQEYKQAYANFAKVLPYEPKVHDTVPEAPEQAPEEVSEEVKAKQAALYKETLLKEYFSEEEIAKLMEDEDTVNLKLNEKAFEKSREIMEEMDPKELSEEEKITLHKYYQRNLEAETETYNKRLENYIKELQSELEKLEKDVDKKWITEEIEATEREIATNNEVLEFCKSLAPKKENPLPPTPVKEEGFFKGIFNKIANSKLGKWVGKKVKAVKNYLKEPGEEELLDEMLEKARKNGDIEKFRSERNNGQPESDLKEMETELAENVAKTMEEEKPLEAKKKDFEYQGVVVQYTTSIRILRDILNGKLDLKEAEGKLIIPKEGDYLLRLKPDGTLEEDKRRPLKMEASKTTKKGKRFNEQGRKTEPKKDEKKSNPFEVSDDVKKATEEVGREAGEKQGQKDSVEVEKLTGDSVVTDEGEIDLE